MKFKMTAWRWSVLVFLLVVFAVFVAPGPDIVQALAGR